MGGGSMSSSIPSMISTTSLGLFLAKRFWKYARRSAFRLRFDFDTLSFLTFAWLLAWYFSWSFPRLTLRYRCAYLESLRSMLDYSGAIYTWVVVACHESPRLSGDWHAPVVRFCFIPDRADLVFALFADVSVFVYRKRTVEKSERRKQRCANRIVLVCAGRSSTVFLFGDDPIVRIYIWCKQRFYWTKTRTKEGERSGDDDIVISPSDEQGRVDPAHVLKIAAISPISEKMRV